MAENELSLRDELSKQFDESENEQNIETKPDESENTEIKVDNKDEKIEPDKEEVKAKDEKKPEAEAQDKEQKDEQKIEKVDLPPSTWSAQAKSEYAKLPQVVRDEIKKREADAQKGITQYKQQAESANKLMAEVQPYMPLIQAEGGTPERAISNLLNTAYRLRTGTPQERGQLVMQIAQQYGADLSQFSQGEDNVEQNIQNYVNQLLQPVVNKFSQFEQKYMTDAQQRESQQQQQINAELESFKNATDEQGNPKHTYFDNVRGIMGSLIANGDAQNLDQAYDMACRAHPEVSQAVSAEQRKRDEAQRLEEARKKADEAKRANIANAEGQGGVGLADTSKLSLRDELSQRFEGRI